MENTNKKTQGSCSSQMNDAKKMHSNESHEKMNSHKDNQKTNNLHENKAHEKTASHSMQDKNLSHKSDKNVSNRSYGIDLNDDND